jgi:hypothetical protein
MMVTHRLSMVDLLKSIMTISQQWGECGSNDLLSLFMILSAIQTWHFQVS